MAMSEDTEKFHSLGPKDVFKDEGELTTTVNITRTTAQTGEQVHISCPLYKTDTREELNHRLQMCYSVLQDRMEQENKIVLENNEKAQKIRMVQESMKRNEKKLEQDKKALRKDAQKQKWKAETLEEKLKDLHARFIEAQDTLANSLPEGAKLHKPPVVKSEDGLMEAQTH